MGDRTDKKMAEEVTMEGKRKFSVIIVGIIALFAGLVFALYKPTAGIAIYATYSGAVVAACGLFFNFNVAEHKSKNGNK